MDTDILEIALRKLSQGFDSFIGECVGEDGNVRAPCKQEIMKARALLPPYCKHAFKRKGE